MLLASPQFSSFLDQMNPLSATNIAAFTGGSSSQQQQSVFTENVTVHRASIPAVRVQPPQQQMDFQVPTYIPPQHQFLNTYNPNKDINPNRPQPGVQDWPLAYTQAGVWGMGQPTVYTADIPEIIADANELAGKDIMDSDVFAPADGFRPGSFRPLRSEKEEPQYEPPSYDSNGQYIFNVFEDELEEVPQYLYEHMDIHAPLSAAPEKEVEQPKPEDVLPALGLEQLFGELERQFFPESPEPVDTSSVPDTTDSVPATCRDPELAKTLRSIETSYRKVGVLCGL